VAAPIYQPEDLIATDIEAYLRLHEHKSLLRFITCGSVDDGKSTLIGRLLYDSKMIFEDQLSALEADSRRIGTQGQEIDFALLVDGLAAEREQGITIDVAYRFFATARNSSSPTRRAMSNTPATCSRAPRRQTWQSF
jgi:bifunctional enzyme CysN/CysC